MNLNNLKVGLRLTLGFGAVLALVTAIVAISYVRLMASERAQVTATEFERSYNLAASWTAKAELNVANAVAIAKSSGLPTIEAYFVPQMKETSAQINIIQQDLDASISSERGKALLATAEEKRKAFLALRPQIDELKTHPDETATEAFVKTKLLPASEEYLNAMGALRSLQRELANDNRVSVTKELQQAEMMLLVLLAVSLCVGAFMALMITRSVTQPVNEAVAAARLIAASDLSQPTMTSDRLDELGDLMRALGDMQQSLRRLVGEVRSTTDGIHTASSEISTGNHDLSVRTEHTASNLQQTASSMEQITATAQASADSARQANQLVATAAEAAQRGGSVVGQVVTTMSEINNSSKKIADIIGVIDGIAFQTNILALNAAVEAARAGEQGRGFAVVASEVRSLAQRSAEAAKEIKSLIGASVGKVEDGSKLVTDAGATMQEIVGAVQRVSDIIGEITAASVEQSAGIGQVNTSVNELDKMTQQNAALVEQSAAAAESLKDQAQRLASVVQVFRLDAHSAASAHAAQSTGAGQGQPASRLAGVAKRVKTALVAKRAKPLAVAEPAKAAAVAKPVSSAAVVARPSPAAPPKRAATPLAAAQTARPTASRPNTTPRVPSAAPKVAKAPAASSAAITAAASSDADWETF